MSSCTSPTVSQIEVPGWLLLAAIACSSLAHAADGTDPSECFLVSGEVTECVEMSLVGQRFLRIDMPEIEVKGARCAGGAIRPPSGAVVEDMRERLSRFTTFFLDSADNCANTKGKKISASFVEIPCGTPTLCTLDGVPLLTVDDGPAQ